jgi:hypothetical protein
MTKKKSEPEFVTMKEFESLTSSVLELVQMMKAKNESSQEPVKESAQEKAIAALEEQEAQPDKGYVPPKWRALVDEHLGKEFGFNVSYPDSGGFIVRIIVPATKSNASQAHLQYYGADIRSKSLANSEGSAGVEKYCKLVAQNLGIKKQNA